MFAELAISPSVFCSGSYGSPDVCDAHLSGLKDVLLNATLTRDLRAGDFREYTGKCTGLDQRGKELLKQMFKQRRLVPYSAALPESPVSPADWIREAMASHASQPLSGILTCAAVKAEFPDALIADVAKRGGAAWWQQEVLRNSWSIRRTNSDYLKLLSPLYRHANSICLIDPHLDPTRPGYSAVGELLLPLAGRADCPQIELHRVCYTGSGPTRTLLSEVEIKRRFSDLSAQLKASNLGATVFVWCDDHDRHILSDIGGLVLGNGVDTSNAPGDSVTWSRIDRATRDEVARRHDPAVNGKLLSFTFKIGV
jgi:hypothetical protein